jgi:aspartate kinase
MDFPLIRRVRKNGDHSAYLNGMGVNGGIENRIPHSRERDLPGGANWVVQKFGGTSVGKFGRVIGEDIVA